MLPCVCSVIDWTSKCGKNKDVAREPQASVSLMFLPHFDVFSDLLLNRPTATWTGIYLFYIIIRKEKRPIHIPASYRLTVRGFVLVQAYFKSQTLLFVSASSFSVILIVYSFLEEFFKVLSCSKHGENILQNIESLVEMTRDGNCCEDFLWFRLCQVVKNSFCLHVTIFLLCKQLLLTVFSRVSLVFTPK